MTAVIIHLDDAPITKGCVRVVPGSHKLGPLPKVSEEDYSLSQERWPIESATPCEARAGDVLIFNYLTIHGSGVNTSDEARTTLLVQVRDPEDRPTVRRHESPGQGMMLAGIDPTCAARPSWETAPAAG
jgi:ectoine hydroxylase-related dioxygenase (phytanoyl-CoA dioxygenase family)